MQRDKLNKLCKELEGGGKGGEKDLVIKFKLSEPVIERKENFRRARRSVKEYSITYRLYIKMSGDYGLI